MWGGGGGEAKQVLRGGGGGQVYDFPICKLRALPNNQWPVSKACGNYHKLNKSIRTSAFSSVEINSRVKLE